MIASSESKVAGLVASIGAAQEALTARILYGGAMVLAGVIVAERG